MGAELATPAAIGEIVAAVETDQCARHGGQAKCAFAQQTPQLRRNSEPANSNASLEMRAQFCVEWWSQSLRAMPMSTDTFLERGLKNLHTPPCSSDGIESMGAGFVTLRAIGEKCRGGLTRALCATRQGAKVRICATNTTAPPQLGICKF